MSTFGDEVDAIWPAIDGELQPISEFGQKLLEQCKKLKKPDAEATVDVRRFMRKSTDFPLEVEYARRSCRWEYLISCIHSSVCRAAV